MYKFIKKTTVASLTAFTLAHGYGAAMGHVGMDANKGIVSSALADGYGYYYSTFYSSTYYEPPAPASTFYSSTYYEPPAPASTFYSSTYYEPPAPASTFYSSTYYEPPASSDDSCSIAGDCECSEGSGEFPTSDTPPAPPPYESQDPYPYNPGCTTQDFTDGCYPY